MPTRQCPGLHPLAHGACAWLAPQGGWGWSNAARGNGRSHGRRRRLWRTWRLLQALPWSVPLRWHPLHRYDAGMDAFEAAKDIELTEYSSWSDPERIAINVDSLYREFSGQQTRTDLFELLGRMAELAGFGAPR